MGKEGVKSGNHSAGLCCPQKKMPASSSAGMMRMWWMRCLLAHSYRAAVGFGAADFLHPAWLAAFVALWGAGAAMGAIAAAMDLRGRLSPDGLPPSLPTGFHWRFWPWGCDGLPLGRRVRFRQAAGLICPAHAARPGWSGGWCVRCLSTGSAHHRHRRQWPRLQRRHARCGRCGGRRIPAHGADRS